MGKFSLFLGKSSTLEEARPSPCTSAGHGNHGHSMKIWQHWVCGSSIIFFSEQEEIDPWIPADPCCFLVGLLGSHKCLVLSTILGNFTSIMSLHICTLGTRVWNAARIRQLSQLHPFAWKHVNACQCRDYQNPTCTVGARARLSVDGGMHCNLRPFPLQYTLPPRFRINMTRLTICGSTRKSRQILNDHNFI